MRAAKAVATPGSRRAGSDATRRLGTEARKSPSSGDLITESFPARDLADSLSAFAAVDFSAEKNMLENAGLTPPTRAILKAAKTPVSGRRALGDVANLTTLRPGTTKSPNEGDAVDDWSVSLNNSVSPPPRGDGKRTSGAKVPRGNPRRACEGCRRGTATSVTCGRI